MLIVGVLIFFVVTLLPGILAVRLLRVSNLNPLNILLYAIGLGLMFNLTVGVVANYTIGIALMPVIIVFLVLLAVLSIFSYKFGSKLTIHWKADWKSRAFIIPLAVYLLAVGLQFQTTLISSNLVGSDIHLEYYHAKLVLEEGVWNPVHIGSSIHTCLGITFLLPVYSLLTGMSLIWIFKVICPVIFAFLPLSMYAIFKNQFGVIISVLSVLFFVTMPMFTMDMVQIIRQQQSELFFVFVVVLLLDDNLTTSKKILLGAVFSMGVAVTHYGMVVGYIGYLAIGFFVLAVLTRLWKNRQRLDDAKAPVLPRLILITIIVTMALGMYVGYYGWVNKGTILVTWKIPVAVIGDTARQVTTGVESMDTAKEENEVVAPQQIKPVEPADEEPETAMTIVNRFPFVDPFWREPILQTAIGLDFGRASALGKTWRILQYLVQICLGIGFCAFMLRPHRKVRLEYMAFVVTSIFVIVGMFVLYTYSYGMGATRVFLVALIFMAPLFVIGLGTIGKGIVRLVGKGMINENKVLICSTLVLFVPYFVFNSGIVFEVAKLNPVGYIDVPYSVALSGYRVDIATIFEDEDVEAIDWLEARIIETEDKRVIFGDTHGARLAAQKFGWNVKRRGGTPIGDLLVAGTIRSLRFMKEEDVGYIFLRKWNVDNNAITYQAEYASRLTYPLGDLDLVKGKIESGMVLFDNGARVILVE